MLLLAVRFGVLMAGLGCAVGAMLSWRSNTPPTWTIFMPAEQALILTSEVRQGRATNGGLRSWPFVEIEWPSGSGYAAELDGLTPSFFGWSASEASAIVADYKAGDMADILTFDGKPYAHRIDLFHAFHAGFLTIMALALTGLGGFIAWSTRTRRGR